MGQKEEDELGCWGGIDPKNQKDCQFSLHETLPSMSTGDFLGGPRCFACGGSHCVADAAGYTADLAPAALCLRTFLESGA